MKRVPKKYKTFWIRKDGSFYNLSTADTDKIFARLCKSTLSKIFKDLPTEEEGKVLARIIVSQVPETENLEQLHLIRRTSIHEPYELGRGHPRWPDVGFEYEKWLCFVDEDHLAELAGISLSPGEDLPVVPILQQVNKAAKPK